MTTRAMNRQKESPYMKKANNKVYLKTLSQCRLLQENKMTDLKKRPKKKGRHSITKYKRHQTKSGTFQKYTTLKVKNSKSLNNFSASLEHSRTKSPTRVNHSCKMSKSLSCKWNLITANLAKPKRLVT